MGEDDRTTVKTYVPRDQKEIWKDAADDLDMSQSEFVRTMVQAGRRSFDLDAADATAAAAGDEDGGAEDATPGGRALEERVLDALSSDTVLDWNELVDELAGDFEDRLDDAVESLEDANRVRYDPRQGGYTRIDG